MDEKMDEKENQQVDPNLDDQKQTESGNEQKTYSEDEVNERVQAALDAAKAEREKQEAEASEAEKLKSMSAAERSKYELEKRESELAARESTLAASELKAAAATMAAEKGIPASAVDLILGKDADETAKRIDTFKTVLDEAVQTAVEERMRGKSPRTGGGSNANQQAAVSEAFRAALKG